MCLKICLSTMLQYKHQILRFWTLSITLYAKIGVMLYMGKFNIIVDIQIFSHGMTPSLCQFKPFIFWYAWTSVSATVTLHLHIGFNCLLWILSIHQFCHTVKGMFNVHLFIKMLHGLFNDSPAWTEVLDFHRHCRSSIIF